jgi:glycosyltransferase involved in cell wall biosynthesis
MRNPTLRIALVLATPGTTWGGMEKHTQELAGALAELGHQVHVLTDKRYKPRFTAPVHFHPLPVNLGRRNPGLALKLRCALTTIQPDVVHAQGSKAAQLVGWLTGPAAKSWIKLGTVHGTKTRHGAYQQLDGIIAVSDDIAASLCHPRIRRIYNGTGVASTAGSSRPAPHEQLLTIAVGRLEPVKGFDRLLQTWARARPDGQLAILGEGSERRRLEQLRHALGLEQSVILPGYQNDISSWLEQAHCCVISSDREGLPYAMIEALLSECPVLATPVSGTRQFLPDDCIARSASSDDLANLLQRKHASDLKQQQTSAFKKARTELTLEAMAEQTLDFYRELRDWRQKPSIDLSASKPFASGYNRHCHVHPENPGICLKVIRPDHFAARFNRQRWHKKLLGARRLDDNRQEQRAYQQTAIKQGNARVWAHLPRFWGQVDTSLGPANASALIRTPDGAPARTLETELKDNGLTSATTDAIHRFTDWLASTGMLTRNLLPHNLVLTEHDNRLELYLIDGLGAPFMASLLSTIPAWRRRYIRRRIQRFWLRIEWELGDRSESWEKAQRIR